LTPDTVYCVLANGVGRPLGVAWRWLVDELKYAVIPASHLRSEEGAKDLMSVPEMQPYLRLGEAAILHQDLGPSLQEIAEIPLEKRYLWRVVSALKWGFADFDDLSLQADWTGLTDEEAHKIYALLRLRPIQFCMMLKVLYGPKGMEKLMVHALQVANEDN
jgi:hypothetical protein